MSKQQTGIAGEFWFCSQLHRLGYEAYITLGNTKSVDISLNLNNETILTFDVKSKINFSADYQYLNISKRKNHFAVFVNLNTNKDKSGKIIFDELGNPIEPLCYILKSGDIDNIAFQWSEKGNGFRANYLKYLKHQDETNITDNNKKQFKERHPKNLLNGEIDFAFYNKIIWTLEDFENAYHKYKEKQKI